MAPFKSSEAFDHRFSFRRKYLENHFGELLNAYSPGVAISGGNQTMAICRYMFETPLPYLMSITGYSFYFDTMRTSARFNSSSSACSSSHSSVSEQIGDLFMTTPHLQRLSLTGTRCEKIRRLDGDFKVGTYLETRMMARKRRHGRDSGEENAAGVASTMTAETTSTPLITSADAEAPENTLKALKALKKAAELKEAARLEVAAELKEEAELKEVAERKEAAELKEAGALEDGTASPKGAPTGSGLTASQKVSYPSRLIMLLPRNPWLSRLPCRDL